CAMGTWTMDYW
nr:immunoglobulin heavy chain junction region [Mus musculus]MBK4198357.1 immunoglobulin heavy chain junction region [Mus musculus]